MGAFLAPNGEVVVIDDPVLAQRALDTGYKPVSAPTAGAALTKEQAPDAGAAVAGVTAGLSGATLGLSDAFLAGIGDRASTRALHDTREAHPTASAIGTGVGALAPAFISGGESLLAAPTRFASGVGRAASTAAAEAGVGRLGSAVLGGAAEGALYGAGNSVSELALSDDPLTMERAASSLSSNLLFGSATGGVLGGAFNVVERGISRAKGVVDGVLERAAAKDVVQTGGAGAVSDAEIASLDKTGLKAAREAELEAVDRARDPARQQFADDLQAHHVASDQEKVWIYANNNADKYVAEQGPVSMRVNKGIRRLLDNVEGIKANPGRALDLLQQEDQMLNRLEVRGNKDIVEYNRAFKAAPGTIRDEILQNKLPGYVVGPGGLRADSPLIDDAVDREIVRRFGGLDEPVLPEHLRVVKDHIGDARFRNRDLQEQLAKLQAEPTSARLIKIDNAIDALNDPSLKAARSLGERALHAIPVVGRVAELASAAGAAAKGLRGAVGRGMRKTAEATSAFLARAEKAAAATAPVATRVLASVRYAPHDDKKEPPPATLAGLYKARTDEIKSQTAYDTAGVPKLRPEARARMAAQLDGVRAADPIAADRIETLAARRIEYLSSLIPRRPDFGIAQLGPDDWQPSDMQMRSFARSVAAVENPAAVEERVARGVVTPEDAAAYWAVYPERAQHFKTEIVNGMATSKTRMPYRKRLALGIFTGTPLDPSMHPVVLARLQGHFAAEPGTQGGTQAPIAQPQFGSLKKSVEVPTPAQTRAQGAMT